MGSFAGDNRQDRVNVAKIRALSTVVTHRAPTCWPASGSWPRVPGTIGTAGRRRTHRRPARL